MLIRYVKYIIYCSIFSVIAILFINYYDSKVIKGHNNFHYNRKRGHLKYILVWTGLNELEEGQKTFIKKSCPVDSCFVTEDRNYFKNVTEFDVILFHGPQISPVNLPEHRLQYQKYIYASMESSANYPLCYDVFNDFFNLTFTYKLSSNLYFGYIVIRNMKGEIIGPKKNMHWLDITEMDLISKEVMDRLSTKRIAAAWFVSHCEDRRTMLAQQLIAELKKYDLTVHVYGECGDKICPRENMPECLQMLERDYYFYFAFENSLTEDYVTEKLLYPLQYYTVPIVYGGANYTRFMPDGAYLNAQTTPVSLLAKQMAIMISNKGLYHDFFRWRNHYSYHHMDEAPETDAFCRLCKAVNNKRYFKKTTVFGYFTKWWNPVYQCFI